METAGHAIVFSGTTVAISLIALVALDVPFLRSIGLGGMLIPLASVAVAITLLPVILATIGPKVDWPRLRRGDQESRLWHRWSEFIVRARVIATVVSLALVIAITIPALSIKGEIGQQLGYANAMGVGTVNFVVLLIIGLFLSRPRAAHRWISWLSRGRLKVPPEDEYAS